METEISTQLYFAAAFLLLGAALGLLYDLLRSLRRALGFDALFDLVFGAIALYALFAMKLNASAYAPPAFAILLCIVGFAVYMLLFARLLSPLFQQVTALLSVIFGAAKKVVKKVAFLAKNVFSNPAAWFTMSKNDKAAGGDFVEVKASADRRDRNGGTACLCGDKPRENDGHSRRGRGDDEPSEG